jgi:hypothetical protein
MGDEEDVRELDTILRQLAPLRERTDGLAKHGPEPGSAAASDARLKVGRYGWDLALASIGAALDHLAGWEVIVGARRFPWIAHYSLLRSAAEGAVHVRWLCEPGISQKDRIGRGVGAQLRDLDDRRKLEDKSPGAVPTGQGRPARIRIQEVHDVLARTRSVNTQPQQLETTDQFGRYGSLPGRKASPGAGLFLYRVLSGAAHGRQWPMLALSEHEAAGDLPTYRGRRARRLTIRLPNAVLVTRMVVELVSVAVDELEVYGRRR